MKLAPLNGKHKRLLYSTGGFCTAAGVSAMESLSGSGNKFEDHILLFSVDGNFEFRAAAAQQSQMLYDFHGIHHLDDYILDPRLKTVDIDLLKKALPQSGIDQIFVFAESSGTRFDALKAIFPSAEIFVYEEGMLGYCDDIFHNSRLGGLAQISAFVSTNYFGKMEPQSLRRAKFKLRKFDLNVLKANLSKLDNSDPALSEELLDRVQDQASALLCSAPLWRFGHVSHSATVEAHVELTKFLCDLGFMVLLKEHPRPALTVYDAVYEQLSETQRSQLIDITAFAQNAETAIERLSPSITVGFGSTTLFNSYELYGVPSFRFKTELVPASLNFSNNHVVNAALKMRYIPDVSKLNGLQVETMKKVDVEKSAKQIFENHLALRANSLDDQIITRVHDRLYHQNWPKVRHPNSVYDYIYLDDTFVSERNKAVREHLSKGPSAMASEKGSTLETVANSPLAYNFLAGLRKNLEKGPFKLKVMREPNYTSMYNELSDLQTKFQEMAKKNAEILRQSDAKTKTIAGLKASETALLKQNAELKLAAKIAPALDSIDKNLATIDKLTSSNKSKLDQFMLKHEPESEYHVFRPVPIMCDTWGPFTQQTSQSDALARLEEMTVGMDQTSIETGRRVIDDAYFARWENPKQPTVMVHTQSLKKRSGIDFSKQEELSEDSLLQLKSDDTVNMGAVMQSLAYAHGLKERTDEAEFHIKGRDVIDAGAYVGDSAFAFMPFSPKQIRCFEPSNASYSILRENIRKAGYERKIIGSRIGLSDKKTSAFLSTEQNAGNHIVDVKANSKSSTPFDIEKVKLTTIDAAAKEHKLDIGLIKIDVEGFEKRVIKGGWKSILKFKPILLISVYHSPSDFFTMRTLIEETGIDYEFQLRKFSYNPVMETILMCIPVSRG